MTKSHWKTEASAPGWPLALFGTLVSQPRPSHFLLTRGCGEAVPCRVRVPAGKPALGLSTPVPARTRPCGHRWSSDPTRKHRTPHSPHAPEAVAGAPTLPAGERQHSPNALFTPSRPDRMSPGLRPPDSPSHPPRAGPFLPRVPLATRESAEAGLGLGHPSDPWSAWEPS